MSRIISTLLLIFLGTQSSVSQVIPQEGSHLNYRLIGFSFPVKKGVSNYSIEIALGNYVTDDSFNKHIIKEVESNKEKIVTEVPQFGTDYTWRVIYQNNRSNSAKALLYHFSTLAIPEIDTNLYRLNVTTQAMAYKDAYVFVDANRTLYDMDGRPVWFLPYTEGNQGAPRDLKLSPKGTITFILFEDIYEVNYNGGILWKGPATGTVSGDSLEHFHHEFTRLKNGHYMVLGSENVLLRLPTPNDSTVHFVTFDKLYKESKAATYKITSLGTVIEYDQPGNVIWSWKSSKYFRNTSIDFQANPNGSRGVDVDVHENAFYFDEKNNNVYVSFKNISRIVKLKYPEGKVVCEYGDKYKHGDMKRINNLFCGQHSCGVSQKGYLYTFNNNDRDLVSGAKIVMMQEPGPGKGDLRKVWEYECPVEKSSNTQVKFRATSGGNVIELPDQSLFAIMYSIEPRMFIVSLDKEILWSAIPEKWNTANKKWEVNMTSYKASIIYDRKNLEHLVWGEEITDH